MDELAKEYEKDFGEDFDVDELAKEYEKDFGEEFDVDELAKEYEKDFGEEFDVDDLIKEYEKDFGKELQEYENVDSQSTVHIHETSEMQEESQEYEEDQLENNEEIEFDPEEYEQNQDPIHDPDEIEFIRDVEELARIMREYTEVSGESEEDVKECDNAGFKAEQAYNESREIEQNQEQKEVNQEVEEKEREITKEGNLEQTAEELSIQEQQEDFEDIEEEFAEKEQEEFEYLWEKYAEYEQEGRSAEEITELMHEAEEAYEVLKRAEEAYNQQEKENLKPISQEQEEELEEYKKEIEIKEELEYFVEAEEKLYTEGKSSQEITKEMQKVENVYEIKEEVEKIYELQEKDKMKLVDHEDEEKLEDERDEIDRRDAIEFLIETEEELYQREKSQEDIDEQMEKIADDYFQNELEKNKKIDKEKELIKEIKNVPKELDEKNSEIEEQKKVEDALTQYDERDIEVTLDAEEEVLEEIESDLEDNVKSDSSQESNIESTKDSEGEESKEDEYEELQELYHKETGRNPMYAGKKTKGFRQWLERQELNTKKMDEKKEEDEGWKKTLKKWIEESREDAINSKLKQILEEILQNFSKYEEFEELLRKYRNTKLNKKEREQLTFIINKFLNKYLIHLQLYYNLSGFKAYFQKQHWWNPWLVKEIKYKFINHLSKKYEMLKHNLKILFEFSKQNTYNKSLKHSKSSRKIIFDNDYCEKFKKHLKIITNHLSIKAESKKIIYEKALELFNYALKKGLKPSNLEVKNSGVLSVVFIYFSLLFNGYTKIKKKVLTYGTICRSLGRNLQTIGISNTKSRNLGIVSKFLPENLRAKYKEFYSKRLYTGRLSFEEFTNLIKELGLKKTGIAGKALSPNFNYNKISANDYQELKSEEYFDLIQNKKGTEIKVPVWCGKYYHTPWLGILSNLLQGKWCRKCADEERITFSLQKLKKIARKRGYEETGLEGKILDSKDSDTELTKETYDRLTAKKSPSKTHFWWSCSIKKHTPWRTTPSHILFDNSWCPICKKGLYTHAELIKLAKIQGCRETGVEGKILDSKNCDKELTLETYNRLTINKKASEISFWWTCERNHPPFKNNPANIRRGQWCPICSSEEGKFEKIIRVNFEKIFGVLFQQVFLRDLNLKYPKMNIDLDLFKENDKIKIKGYKVNFNNSNRFKIYDGKMRFDGYAEIIINGKLIKIAFEYNGIQHYEFPNYWFRDSINGFNSWIKYIERDQIKKEICKLNNIYLIEIPYYIDLALEHPEKIRSYIINQFELITSLKLAKNQL